MLRFTYTVILLATLIGIHLLLKDVAQEITPTMAPTSQKSFLANVSSSNQEIKTIKLKDLKPLTVRRQVQSVKANSSTKTSTKIEKNQAEDKAFNVTVDLSFTSNLKSDSTNENEQSAALNFLPSYKFTDSISLIGDITVTQNLTGFKDTILENSAAVLRKSVELNPTLTAKFDAIGILPTNSDANAKSTLQGAGGLRAGLTKTTAIAGKSTTLGASIYGLKYVHQFETNNNNVFNLSERLRTTGSIDVSLTDKITLSGLARYDAGRTYARRLKSSFLITEELAYALDDTKTVYLAHANGGSALEENGKDSTIAVYDKDASEISVGINGSF